MLCKNKPMPASSRSIFPQWKRSAAGAWECWLLLDRWARDHDIQLKLFSPSRSVVDGLVHNRLMPSVDIATFHEMMDLLADADSRYSIAA